MARSGHLVSGETITAQTQHGSIRMHSASITSQYHQLTMTVGCLFPIILIDYQFKNMHNFESPFSKIIKSFGVIFG